MEQFLDAQLNILVNEYIFLETKLNNINTIISNNKKKYLNDINSLISDNDLDIPTPYDKIDNLNINDKYNTKELIIGNIDNESINLTEHKNVKKVYKKLVKLTHPDNNSSILSDLNKNIINNKNNIIYLIYYSILLNINIATELNDDIDNISEYITDSIGIIKNDIAKNEKNLLYKYEINKEVLLKKYLLEYLNS